MNHRVTNKHLLPIFDRPMIHYPIQTLVDRRIHAHTLVFDTNLRGTFTLLEAIRACPVKCFVPVSTDEVYGSLPAPAEAHEQYPLRASSPYSAAKAGSDLLALSYFTTYKLPVLVTRVSNNYGPYHFPEALIPLMITNAFDNVPIPGLRGPSPNPRLAICGRSCDGIRAVLNKGREGEIYNIGGNRSLENIEVVKRILEATGRPESLIECVADRPGHDTRYVITSKQLERET